MPFCALSPDCLLPSSVCCELALCPIPLLLEGSEPSVLSSTPSLVVCAFETELLCFDRAYTFGAPMGQYIAVLSYRCRLCLRPHHGAVVLQPRTRVTPDRERASPGIFIVLSLTCREVEALSKVHAAWHWHSREPATYNGRNTPASLFIFIIPTTMATPKALRSFTPFICQSCRQHIKPKTFRSFVTSSKRRAEADSLGSFLDQAGTQSSNNRARNGNRPVKSASSYMLDAFDRDPGEIWGEQAGENMDFDDEQPPHRLHVYATKHNTHITLVQPQKSAAKTASSRISGTSASSTEQKKQVDTLLSISSGNIGFRKAGRGSYDAAFQLAAFALKQMQERGMLRDLKKLEVVLRGFGAGREAVTKALLGVEGRHIRQTIVGVKDATRLKQGGPRSKKPRRLG